MISTNYGVLTGEYGVAYYDNGSLKGCALEEECPLKTELGVLIPKYQISESRTKHRNAIEFYDDGVLKSIYLEKKTSIPTVIGDIEAELVTFYTNGNVHRIFPLFGQISGFWSEEEEKKLAQDIKINMPGVYIQNKVSCICFYEKGNVKSISLYNGETVNVINDENEYEARIGLSFYENGKIKSLEPKTQTLVKTPIGIMFAYDNNPIGIHGDDNSLKFNEDGSVKKLIVSASTAIKIIDKDGNVTEEKAIKRPSMLEIDKYVMEHIAIEFYRDKIEVIDSDKNKKYYTYKDNIFSIVYNDEFQLTCDCTDCSSCNGCNH
jgi:MORN repeat variant.